MMRSLFTKLKSLWQITKPFDPFDYHNYPATPPENPDYPKCDTAKHTGPQRVPTAGPSF